MRLIQALLGVSFIDEYKTDGDTAVQYHHDIRFGNVLALTASVNVALHHERNAVS